jgi:predicted nucleic acid-binding protein
MSVLVDTSVWIRFLANRAPYAAEAEVVAFVRHSKLNGRGIGWIDAHLLASALVGRLKLWTADSPLAVVAKKLGIEYE